MSGRLSATIALYLGFLAAWSLLRGFRGGELGPWRLGLLVVWVALAAQAVVATAAVASGGHEVTDPATFWGYLASSVLLLPLAAARLDDADPRAGAFALAVVLLALCIVVWRLSVLWHAG